MKKIEIKLNDLPKYLYDKIIDAFIDEYGGSFYESSIDVNLYIDKATGIRVEITKKLSSKDKNELLRVNLEHFLNGRVFYSAGGIININILYEEYKKWCIANNIPYYKSIDSFRSDRFQKYLTKKGMSCNKDTVFNGLLASVIIR